jgi:hypothetical protein
MGGVFEASSGSHRLRPRRRGLIRLTNLGTAHAGFVVRSMRPAGDPRLLRGSCLEARWTTTRWLTWLARL